MSEREIRNLNSDLILPKFPEDSERAKRATSRGDRVSKSNPKMGDTKPSTSESKEDIAELIGFKRRETFKVISKATDEELKALGARLKLRDWETDSQGEYGQPVRLAVRQAWALLVIHLPR